MSKDFSQWGSIDPMGQETLIDRGQSVHQIGVNRPYTKERLQKKERNKGKTMNYQEINDEGEEVKKYKGLKIPISSRGVFNYKDELEKLRKHPANAYKIAGLFMFSKGYKIENWGQYYPLLARTVKTAKEMLLGYSSNQIIKAMDYCKKEWGENWTLETVGRWVADTNLK